MPFTPYICTRPDDPARNDDGLFGPGSVTWRIMSSRIMWVAALRALYLQALHPRVIRGTLQNAPGITQPVDGWARLRRTRMFIETRTFGTTAEAERAGRRVRKIHEALTGTDPDGTRYRVDEPGLLLWVHCSEVASCVDIARRSGLPFSAADLDAFVAEQRASAELIGVDRAAAPASVAGLDAYYEEIRPRLYACDEAKQALHVILLPPVPDGNRVLKLGMPPVSALAFATLPRWARQMYGRPAGPLGEAAATAGLRAARLMFSQQRLFAGAMRAIQRAESAAGNQAHSAGSGGLEDRGHALAAAGAHGLRQVAPVPAAQLAQAGGEHPGTGGPDRVAERDARAVDVEFVRLVPAPAGQHGEHLDGETIAARRVVMSVSPVSRRRTSP